MLVWLAEAGPILASALVLFAPGLAVGLAIGLRGLALWALAPAATTAVFTTTSLVGGLLGQPWRPMTALIGTILVAAVAFAARRVLAWDRAPWPPSRGWRRALPVAGIIAGISLTAWRIALYIGMPSAISQSNDAIFHLSALRFAVETGLASPLELGRVIGSSAFYPSAWHILGALVPQLTGIPVEVAANTMSLVIAALAWPLGVAYLARVAAGPIAAAVAAGLAAAIPAFPLVLLQWGVLYPQLLAVALLPGALAAVSDWGSLQSTTGRAGWLRPVVIAAASAAGVLAAQPSVILAWIVGALTIAGWAIVAVWRSVARRRRIILLGALGLGTAGAAGIWIYFAHSTAVTWPPSASKPLALVEVAMNGMLGYPWAVGASLLAFIGLAASFRSPSTRWLSSTWIILGGLYFVAAAIGNPLVRSLLVGAWYQDPYRLAAMTPVVVLPLAGAGAAWVAAWAARTIGSTIARAGWVALGSVTIVGIVSLVVAPQIAWRDVFVRTAAPNQTMAEQLLSPDELALLRRLEQTLPEDAVAIGNPGTGMAFGYAVSGRNVIPRSWSPPRSADYTVLRESLRDVATNPAVCPALAAFGAEYVLDFGPGEATPGRWIMPGFTDIEGQAGFELVDREGAASLWRVTACG